MRDIAGRTPYRSPITARAAVCALAALLVGATPALAQGPPLEPVADARGATDVSAAVAGPGEGLLAFVGTDNHVKAVPLSAGGFGTAQTVSTAGDEDVPAHEPDVAMSSPGNGVVVWTQPGDDVRALMARRLVDGQWGDAVVLDSASSFVIGEPEVELSSDGNGVVVYTRQAGGTPQEVRAKALTGGSWQALPTIFESPGHDYEPRVDLSADGHGLAAWRQGAVPGNFPYRSFGAVLAGGQWNHSVDLSGADVYTEPVADVAATAPGQGWAIFPPSGDSVFIDLTRRLASGGQFGPADTPFAVANAADLSASGARDGFAAVAYLNRDNAVTLRTMAALGTPRVLGTDGRPVLEAVEGGDGAGLITDVGFSAEPTVIHAFRMVGGVPGPLVELLRNDATDVSADLSVAGPASLAVVRLGTRVVAGTLTVTRVGLSPPPGPHKPGSTVAVPVSAGYGLPAPGRVVRFEVTGANAAGGRVEMDANGLSSIAWIGANAGRDTLVAYADFNDDGTRQAYEPLATAIVDWASDPPPPDDPPGDPDGDRDSIPDGRDNCPDVANADQVDADEDRIGDACEVLPLGNTPPRAGVSTLARLVSGEVFVRLPARRGRRSLKQGGRFLPLKGVAALPVGTVVDSRKGRMAMTSAANTRRATDRRRRLSKGRFAAGMFRIRQARAKGVSSRPLPTDLVLASAAGAERICRSSRAGRSSKGVVRTLSASGKGVFRTVGGASIATARNAIWNTADRCDGTVTQVGRGSVKLRELQGEKRTFKLRAGNRYVAKARLFAAKKGRGKRG